MNAFPPLTLKELNPAGVSTFQTVLGPPAGQTIFSVETPSVVAPR